MRIFHRSRESRNLPPWPDWSKETLNTSRITQLGWGQAWGKYLLSTWFWKGHRGPLTKWLVWHATVLTLLGRSTSQRRDGIERQEVVPWTTNCFRETNMYDCNVFCLKIVRILTRRSKWSRDVHEYWQIGEPVWNFHHPQHIWKPSQIPRSVKW